MGFDAWGQAFIILQFTTFSFEWPLRLQWTCLCSGFWSTRLAAAGMNVPFSLRIELWARLDSSLSGDILKALFSQRSHTKMAFIFSRSLKAENWANFKPWMNWPSPFWNEIPLTVNWVFCSLLFQPQSSLEISYRAPNTKFSENAMKRAQRSENPTQNFCRINRDPHLWAYPKVQEQQVETKRVNSWSSRGSTRSRNPFCRVSPFLKMEWISSSNHPPIVPDLPMATSECLMGQEIFRTLFPLSQNDLHWYLS